MRNREKIESVKYDDIDDEMLRSDLMGITQKLKAEIIDNPDRLKMPIAEFQRNWLNMFICKLDPKDQTQGIPVVRWINEVTRNPYTWVDVILPDGSVAYSVPPLLNSDAVEVTHTDFYHHLMEMQAMVDHGAAKGEVERYRERNVMQFIGSNPAAETYMNEINKMAMFHGYAPFTPMDGVSVTPDGEVKKSEESTGFGKPVRVDDF